MENSNSKLMLVVDNDKAQNVELITKAPEGVWLIRIQRLVCVVTEQEANIHGIDPEAPESQKLTPAFVDLGQLAPIACISQNTIYSGAEFGSIINVYDAHENVWLFRATLDEFMAQYLNYVKHNPRRFTGCEYVVNIEGLHTHETTY